VIRKAKPGDANNIIELLVELGRPKPRQKEVKHFAMVIHKYISDRDKAIFVAEADSKVIGMISLVFLPRLNRTRTEAWIPDLIVNRRYRDRGIGKELLEKCIAMARKKCWRVRLETGLSRRRSQKFYKMLGMEPFALSFMLPL
jgi:ribosomal protein S18 acetylase RimI-like enzyme